MADPYSVRLCKQEGGAPGANGAIAEDGAGTQQVTRDCSQFGDGIRVRGDLGQSGEKRLVMTVPAGGTLVSAQLFHSALLPPGAQVRVVALPGGENVLPVVNAPGADHSVTPQAPTLPPGTTGLAYVVDCGDSCGGTVNAGILSANLTIDDPTDPVVTASAALSGQLLAITTSSTDAVSGVCEVKALLNGQALETRALSRQPLTRPCDERADLTFTTPHGGLDDGVHKVRVESRDAAGRLGAADVDVVIDRKPPAGSGVPGIVGIPEVGQTLTVSNGQWSAQSPSFTYRWERCRDDACVPIAGAESATYVVREEDQEQELRVVETAKDGGGSAALASARTAKVSPQIPVLLEPLRIVGEEKVGGRLSSAGGTWRNAVALRYQWMSCSRRDGSDCKVLPGRERPVLDIEREDVGRYLVLVVTATGPRGHTAQTSAASSRIPYPPLRNLTQPSIGGTATLGGRLTAETGAWEGESVRFETQWLRCNSTGCLPIDGAIARSYRPTTKDLGASLVVLVTARDGLGETLPVRSRATERVRSADGRALPVPRVRTRVRIVTFGDFQFALTVGPKLQVLDVRKGSRVDVLCRLCARARLGRRSKVKTSTVTFRLPSDGVQIPPGGQIVVRVRRKGIIGREIVGTLSLDRSRRVRWGQVRCLSRNGSLQRVSCPAKAPKKKATEKKKTSSSTPSGTTKTGTGQPPATPPVPQTTPAA